MFPNTPFRGDSTNLFEKGYRSPVLRMVFFCSIDDGPTNIKFFFCFPEFLILAFFLRDFLQLICFSPIILKLERHFLSFGCAGSSLLHRLSLVVV